MKEAEKTVDIFLWNEVVLWILSELCSNWQFSVFCCTQTNTCNTHVYGAIQLYTRAVRSETLHPSEEIEPSNYPCIEIKLISDVGATKVK